LATVSKEALPPRLVRGWLDPARIATALLEPCFTDRGLGLLVLAFAALLVYGGWIRPPLSPDLRTLYVPLGAWDLRDAATPEEILMKSKGVPPDSLGLMLFGLLAVGAVVVLWQPKWTGAVCGMILAASICGNLVLVNHPGLVELMDLEYGQRCQMVTTIGRSPVTSPLTGPFNGRIIGHTGSYEYDQMAGDSTRSLVYLDFGRWLIPLTALGCVLGTGGGLRRRIISILVWITAGFGLSGLVCARRLYAEFYWSQALREESRAEYGLARRSLNESLAAFPELRQLERTWLFMGKLDHAEGQMTTAQRFFRAYQLNRDQELPRGVTTAEDLGADPLSVLDDREELHPMMTGPYLDVSPSIAGAHNFQVGLSRPEGFDARNYARSHDKERRIALDLMEQLCAGQINEVPAIRRKTARLWTQLGLTDYPGPSGFTDSTGLIFFPQNRALGAAHAKWRRALELEPHRHDCAFYLSLSRGRLDLNRPELARTEFARLENRLADRILRAELLDSLGDTYFEAGHISEAMRLYAESMDIFSLPKLINYRGQKALGGL
jgi:tetratricopeptide (TPR) repeat protein